MACVTQKHRRRETERRAGASATPLHTPYCRGRLPFCRNLQSWQKSDGGRFEIFRGAKAEGDIPSRRRCLQRQPCCGVLALALLVIAASNLRPACCIGEEGVGHKEEGGAEGMRLFFPSQKVEGKQGQRDQGDGGPPARGAGPSSRSGTPTKLPPINRDMAVYRQRYPEQSLDRKSLDENIRFYRNELRCVPDEMLIEEIHKEWADDYGGLERRHGYIQWLFPIHEMGVNSEAQVLQRHEAASMMSDPVVMRRIRRSYEMMLGFYGAELKEWSTGVLRRAPNYKERFRNLNSRSHNYLRITRILKFLGEVGLERLKLPFLAFWAKEVFVEKSLANPGNPHDNVFFPNPTPHPIPSWIPTRDRAHLHAHPGVLQAEPRFSIPWPAGTATRKTKSLAVQACRRFGGICTLIFWGWEAAGAPILGLAKRWSTGARKHVKRAVAHSLIDRAGRSLKDYWIFTLREDADLAAMLSYLKDPTGDAPLSVLHDGGAQEEGGGIGKRGSPQGGGGWEGEEEGRSCWEQGERERDRKR